MVGMKVGVGLLRGVGLSKTKVEILSRMKSTGDLVFFQGSLKVGWSEWRPEDGPAPLSRKLEVRKELFQGLKR